jgi:hypothetical protein
LPRRWSETFKKRVAPKRRTSVDNCRTETSVKTAIDLPWGECRIALKNHQIIEACLVFQTMKHIQKLSRIGLIMGLIWMIPMPLVAGDVPSTADMGKSYAVHVFGGQNFDEYLSDFFKGAGTGRYNDAYLAGAAASKRLATWNRFSIEIEGGVAQHFGSYRATELWSAVFLRYHAFPWNEYIYTTAAASVGLSYLSKVPEIETRKNGGRGSHLLHYFAPEITFALPEHKDMELVFRLHHRSGVGGLFNGVRDATNVPTVGFRFRY